MDSKRSTAREGAAKQRSRFVSSEADAYFRRNEGSQRGTGAAEEARAAQDPILRAFEALDLHVDRAIEIGSGTGWRLARLQAAGRAKRIVGLEPSHQALALGKNQSSQLGAVRGTAESLPFASASADLVILGFFLYLADREDLFRIGAEVHRVLSDRGTLAILDFDPPEPRSNEYRHAPGLSSYKQDYSRMFTWHPAYRLQLHEASTHEGGSAGSPDDRIAVWVLERNDGAAYPRSEDLV